MTAPAATEPIPTDHAGLYEYLSKLQYRDRVFVAERLAVQLGGTAGAIARAAELVESSLREIEDSENAERAARQLGEQLAAASKSIETARRTLGALMDDYHVEYAEGRTGQDLCALLDDAGRFLRAAIAVNPCQPATNGTGQ